MKHVHIHIRLHLQQLHMRMNERADGGRRLGGPKKVPKIPLKPPFGSTL